MSDTIQTRQGEPGKTPYQRAVELGLFDGTEAEYNASLQGEDGLPGLPGPPGSPDTPQQIADKYHLVAREFTDADAANLANATSLTLANEEAIDELGSASTADTGTAIGNVVELVSVGGNPGLPAVDGSALTFNLPATDPFVANRLWNEGGTLRISAGFISAITEAVNAERTLAGSGALTPTALAVIEGIEKHLKGIDNEWSSAAGVVPISVWDDIVFWSDFSSQGNIGTGTKVLAYISPDSVNTVAEATIKGDLINGQQFGQRSDESSNQRIEFDISGYQLPHTATSIWVGQKPRNGITLASWQQAYDSTVNFTPTADPNTIVFQKRNNASTDGVGEVRYFGSSNSNHFSSRPGPAINWFDEGSFGSYRREDTTTSAYTYTTGDTSDGDMLIFSAWVRTDANQTVIPMDSDAMHGQFLLVERVLTAEESRDLAEAIMAASVQLQTDGQSSFVITDSSTESDGSVTHSIASRKIGYARVRVKTPVTPTAGRPHRYLHVLQATEPDKYSNFGDGFDLAVMQGYEDIYNMTIVSVDIEMSPWYCDHSDYSTRAIESFYLGELIPWVEANHGTAGDAHVLTGFSKSGNGSLSLLFRNPDVFAAAAIFDAPLDMQNISDQPGFSAETQTAYGTEENFDEYNITTLSAAATDFQSGEAKIWLSYSSGAAPANGLFGRNIQAFANTLTADGVEHEISDIGASNHGWTTAWLDPAVLFLDGATD